MRLSSTAAELLFTRNVVGVVAYGEGQDLRQPPRGVVLSSGDTTLTVDVEALLPMIPLFARTDRVWVFDEARPALRRLLAAGVHVARPVCRTTLTELAEGTRSEATSLLPASEAIARDRAQPLVAKLDTLIDRLDARGHKRVARLESIVLPAFAAMEHRGLPIDVHAWRALVDAERVHVAAAKEAVFAAAGAHVHRDLFGVPDIRLDADAEVRALFARVTGAELEDVNRYTLRGIDHPLAAALLRYRESNKIVSTYGDAFLDRVDGRTGRIHASFIPLGASTGRVACRDPNIQNLPSDSRFHTCIHPGENRKLVTADYGTCELRIVAEMAGDRVFREAFLRGDDLHATVATTMFGVAVSKTERPDLRQRAKAINFGLVYGMGPAALSASLGVDRTAGEALLAQYFQTFPKIRDFLEDSVDRALSRGYSETLFGRRLLFDKARLSGENARGDLSRIMKNMPIQGTSADMTKLAMARVHERLQKETRGDAGLINTVHDEIVVECSEADAAAVAVAVREEMEAAHTTLLKTIPPLVELQVSSHWQH
jgi:DNA polymerase I